MVEKIKLFVFIEPTNVSFCVRIVKIFWFLCLFLNLKHCIGMSCLLFARLRPEGFTKAFLHLSCVNAPSPLRTDQYTMNARGCALIASTCTLAKCEYEEQKFMMLFMDCYVTVAD